MSIGSRISNKPRISIEETQSGKLVIYLSE